MIRKIREVQIKLCELYMRALQSVHGSTGDGHGKIGITFMYVPVLVLR